MSKKFNPKTNPRFVLVIGAIREVFPDIPDNIDDDGTVLWDRQEKKKVVTVHSDYANAICLELNHNTESQPFTNLENWFNLCSNAGLVSEGIPATK